MKPLQEFLLDCIIIFHCRDLLIDFYDYGGIYYHPMFISYYDHAKVIFFINNYM